MIKANEVLASLEMRILFRQVLVVRNDCRRNSRSLQNLSHIMSALTGSPVRYNRVQLVLVLLAGMQRRESLVCGQFWPLHRACESAPVNIIGTRYCNELVDYAPGDPLRPIQTFI